MQPFPASRTAYPFFLWGIFLYKPNNYILLFFVKEIRMAYM